MSALAEDGIDRPHVIERHLQQEAAGQQHVFEAPPIEAPEVVTTPAKRDVDSGVLAQAMWLRFHGPSRTPRQMYAEFANTDVFASEVEKAITRLKRDGLAEYNTEIHFQSKGS